jgi:hypothetical protein
MINRKRRRRLVVVGLLAFVLGTTGFAYAASLTFNGGTDAGRAGSGTGTISGYDVTNVKYTLDNNDPAVITGVQFALTPDTATTAKANINGGAWATCAHAGGAWTCPVTGNAQAAVNLGVAAAD